MGNLSKSSLEYKLLVVFIIGIIIQLLFVGHSLLVNKKVWAPILIVGIEILFFLILELYALILAAYLIIKKQSFMIWGGPFFYFLGLIIFVIGLLSSGLLNMELLNLSLVSFYILKLVGFGFAVKVVFSLG